jgi:phosphatidylinositol 3-kinase
MTTSEPVITAALLQTRHYDVFHAIKKTSTQSFVSARDVQQPFRVKLCRIEFGGSENGVTANDVVADVQLFVNGEAVGPLISSGHSIPFPHAGAATGTERGVSWDEHLFFPINVSQLPLDSRLRITFRTVEGFLGEVCCYPFTSRGELKVGLRQYAFLPHTLPAMSPATPQAKESVSGSPSSDWTKLDRDFRRGRLTSVPWLDSFSNQRMQQSSLVKEPESSFCSVVIDFPSTSTSQPIFHMSVPRDYDSLAPHYAAVPSPFAAYHDLDIESENLSEIKAATLAKSLHMVGDKNAQPSFRQKRQLRTILSRPPIRMENLKVDDAALLWQFRHSLLREQEGFVAFMACVDWADPVEREEGEQMIHQWKATILVEDALLLLSSEFKTVLPLRRFAVNVLSRLSDETCNAYLLQLVQGARYDSEFELTDFLISRALKCWTLCSNLFWFVNVEEHLDGERGVAVFSSIKKRLLQSLTLNAPSFHARLERMEDLRKLLVQIHRTLTKEASKDRKKRIEQLKLIIDEKSCGIQQLFVPEVDTGDDTSENQIFLPTHPNRQVVGMVSQSAFIFKSAKQPLKIPFLVVEKAVDGSAEASKVIELMWKSGDDVRQDQLVIQMIRLFDDLLKQNGLDLCLTPYRVLATSPNDGFVEVVPNCTTFQDVEKEGVVRYLRKFHSNQSDFDAAMDRFVKSCAGYCVITFLLGIGDRHLENLLLISDGRLFHIDFGFILGHDPKPFPPPMKLNKEMVEAMGGLKSKSFLKFKEYTCSAYNIIRKHAKLLLHLLVLMAEASIEQISGGTDPKVNFLKVQDKLRLDLNDAAATQYIQGVIDAAIGSFFTNVWDIVHKKAQDLRH